MTDEYLAGIMKKTEPVQESRTLLCIGGHNDGRVINLSVQCNSVEFPYIREEVKWKEDNEPQPEAEEMKWNILYETYSIRKIDCHGGRFIEVLGLVGWTDHKVFKHLIQHYERV